MVSTNLTGRSKNTGCEKFEIDEKEHLLKKCPSGYKPMNSTFCNNSYRVHFNIKTL